jgi:RNA polymerase sigma-70 factor, ECF subfamily
MSLIERRRAFDALIRSLSADLYRFGYWLCKNHAQTQDLLQECYLRAWKSAEDLRDPKSAKAWMMTILRREFLRTFERKQLDVVDLSELSIEDKLSADLDEHSDINLLRQVIGRLEDKYRVPLVLQVVGGLSSAEIAVELRSNTATINTQLFRAREQLKAHFDAANSTSITNEISPIQRGQRQ